QPGQFLAGGEDGGDDPAFALVDDVFRVARPEDDVGALEDERFLAPGDAHQVGDDPQRQPGGDVGDEVAFPSLDDGIDDLGGESLDVLAHGLGQLGREAPGDDAAHPGGPGG